MRGGCIFVGCWRWPWTSLVRRCAPTVLVLANASIHKAPLARARHPEWAARGLRLLFLPPYSPELNKIERLWHRCKHYWVRPEDYQTDRTLLERVEYVLQRIGTTYTLTFA